MSSDLFAARLNDPILHTTLLSDIISGVGTFATYALAGAAVVVAIGAVVGTGGAAAVGIGALYTAGSAVVGGCVGGMVVSAAAGSAVSALFGKHIKGFWNSVADSISPPKAMGTIVTGSRDTMTNSRNSARAAGAIPNESILATLYPDKYPPKEEEPEEEPPEEDLGFWGRAGKIASGAWGFVKNVAKEFWDPTDTPPHKDAVPKDLDMVNCSKGIFSSHGIKHIAQGSMSVLINSQPAARQGDKTDCGAVLEPNDPHNVWIGGPTATVRPVKTGRYPIEQIITLIFLAKSLKDLFKAGANFSCFFFQMAIGAGTGLVTNAVINVLKKPVNAATGAKFLGEKDEQDFIVGSAHPFIWQRFYNSIDQREGALGKGWSLPFDIEVKWKESADSGKKTLVFIDWQGRELDFGEVDYGTHRFFTNVGLHLFYFPQVEFSNHQILIETVEGDGYLFEQEDNGNYQLVQISDRNLNTYKIAYENGRVSQIHDEYKDVDLRLTYNKSNTRLLKVTQCKNEFTRNLVEYRYDAQNNLTEVLKGGKIRIRFFAYNENRLLIRHDDADGLRCFYEWGYFPDAPKDTEWRVIAHHVENSSGKRLESYRLEYDIANRMVNVYEEGGATTHHEWDENYKITSYTNEVGATWKFEWEGDDLISHYEPQGEYYEYSYDELGNLEKTTNPLGEQACTKWHEHWAIPLRESDFDGNVWKYSYDENGNLLTVTDPEDAVTKYRYNDLGLVTEIIDAEKHSKYYKYTQDGRLSELIDCSNKVTKVAYTEWGEVRAITDAMGTMTHYQVDEFGRLISVKRADGQTQHYEYDHAYNVITIKNFVGRDSFYQYNSRGQVTYHKDEKGQETHFQYDRFGRLVTLQNANQEAYKFKYDQLSRLIEQVDISGIRNEYHYNLSNQLESLTQHPEVGSSEEKILHHFAYDPINRVIQKITAENHTLYHYAKNKLNIDRVSIEEWNAAKASSREPIPYDQFQVAYDARGLLKKENNGTGEFNYNYDALGNLLETKLPDGRKLSHLYYGSGHLHHTSLIDGEQKHAIVDYERDNLHREILRTQGKLNHHTEYDGIGRITSKIAKQATLSDIFAPVIEKQFGYDHDSNLVRRSVRFGRQETPHMTSSADRTDYYYDEVNQIIGEYTKAHQTAFEYDAAANLIHFESETKHNRVLAYKNLKYTYDGFGRMKTREGYHGHEKQRFIYDSEHRLIKVELLNHATVKAVEFQYDVIGRRTHKTKYSRFESSPSETTTFLWSGMRMIEEQSKLMGEDHSCVYIYNDQSYEPIARVERYDNDLNRDKVHYFHTNINGCPEEMTHHDGKFVWQSRLSIFGKTIKEDLDENETFFPQNLRYQGQYLDRETGLHYNTFRYYDPEIGKFTQRDPIGLAGGFNLYQYAPNSIMWIDPWGWSNLCATTGQTKKDSYEQARNKALTWLEERGFKAERVNTGKFGSTKGQPVGMTTADGKTGFRIEFDDRSGAHINVFSGKDKGDHFFFDASESTVTKLQNLFNLPSKPWRGS